MNTLDNITKIKDFLKQELERQEGEIDLIASENYASQDVLDACGHAIQNKYSEGWVPDASTGEYRRFYEGCQIIDKIEQMTIDLACMAFKCRFANVQPHSGSSANLAVYETACRYWKCKPQDITIISHSLNSCSHLTHGSKASVSGRWFNAKQFETDDNGLFNYDEFIRLIKETEGYIVAVIGFSAYPREVDYKHISSFIKELDKEIFILIDTSHVSGLIVAGEHQNPFDYDWGKARVILTSTTHKTLRGSRHALIATNDAEIAPIIDKAVFPSLQGGALQNMIAGLGIALSESLTPEFKEYIKQLKANIKAMEGVFRSKNVDMVTGGSDNHLILLDLRSKGISGRELELLLEKIGITTNKNAVKNDPLPKTETSGLRVGTAAVTTRGATEQDCIWIASIICNCIDMLSGNYDYDGKTKEQVINNLKIKTKNWCNEHPIYKKNKDKQ